MHPGQHLVERDIAGLYGVSRTVVRAVLKDLENDGLVKSIPNKGAFVRSLSVEEVYDVYETRSVLEGYASRIAVPRLSGGMVQKIESLIHTAAGCVARHEYKEAHSYDQELHYIFLENCGNQCICRMVKELWVFALRLRWRAFRIPGRSEQTITEHLAILKALKEGDADKVESLARHHIITARDILLEEVKKGLVEL
jgi:DNA-binding GntR family transcriptional regulator